LFTIGVEAVAYFIPGPPRFYRGYRTRLSQQLTPLAYSCHAEDGCDLIP
jgi:hypothetical protein